MKGKSYCLQLLFLRVNTTSILAMTLPPCPPSLTLSMSWPMTFMAGGLETISLGRTRLCMPCQRKRIPTTQDITSIQTLPSDTGLEKGRSHQKFCLGWQPMVMGSFSLTPRKMVIMPRQQDQLRVALIPESKECGATMSIAKKCKQSQINGNFTGYICSLFPFSPALFYHCHFLGWEFSGSIRCQWA